MRYENARDVFMCSCVVEMGFRTVVELPLSSPMGLRLIRSKRLSEGGGGRPLCSTAWGSNIGSAGLRMQADKAIGVGCGGHLRRMAYLSHEIVQFYKFLQVVLHNHDSQEPSKQTTYLTQVITFLPDLHHTTPASHFTLHASHFTHHH